VPGSRRLGSDAEDRAAQILLEKGYTIVGRRIRVGPLELDLVAMEGETWVFVEVKQRTKGGAAESITATKKARLRQASEAYLFREFGRLDIPARWDVILFEGDEVHHLVNAFVD
jgi:putative endonuclease